MESNAQRLPRDITSAAIPVEDSPFANRPMPDMADVEPPTPKSKTETELILKSLLASYVGIGKTVAVFSPADGIKIVQNAEELCESWRMLLDNDPKLRKTMLKAVKGSGWGAVISAHAMVAVAIAGNHPEAVQHLIKPLRRNKQDDGAVSAN